MSPSMEKVEQRITLNVYKHIRMPTSGFYLIQNTQPPKKKSYHRFSLKPQKDGEPVDEVPVPQTASADVMESLKIRLIAASAIVLIGCLFIALTFLGVFRKSGPASSLPCVGEECHETMLNVDQLMDSHIKPCRDFYRHVCHHWIDKPADQPPTSFMIDMAHNYTKVWHWKLTQDHIRGDYAPLKQDASHFYRSCLVFHEKPIDVGAATEELFHALELPLKQWFDEKSPENFFRDIIRLSFGEPFPLAGPSTCVTWNSTSPASSKRSARNWPATLSSTKSLKLDIKRARIVVEDGRTERSLEDADCRGFPADMWRRALQKALSSKEQQVDVKIEAADAICEDLNTVLRSHHQFRPDLCTFWRSWTAPVVHYDYKLSGERDPVAVKHACYRTTGYAFEDVWLQLLSSFLAVSNRVEKAVDDYMNLVKLRMSEHLRDRSWMSEQDRSATLGKLAKVRIVTANFTSNLVALRSRDVQKCLFYPEFSGSDARVVKVLAGTNLVTDPETLTVYLPVSFTIPPMYHRRVDSDKFVNMALLGVQLARKVVALLGRKSFNPPPAKCYTGVSASYHRHLDDSQFDDAFAVVDAMRLAYAGKREYDVDVVRRNEKRMTDSNAAFFKLACLSLCTSRDVVPDANTLDFEASYAACLFGATALPQFAQAFQCRRGDRMWNINRCCVD
ncbi:hypothetical protein MTO96_002438 [Rhipicephalus appendiculatus]